MEQMAMELQPVAIAAAMMVLDVLTGFAGAAMRGAVQSGKMREGLWHKAGFFGLMALALVYEVAASWINVEAAGAGISMPELPAVGAVCAFVVATEVVSILENLCELNPEIAKLPVVRSLKPHDTGAPSLDVKIELGEGE